MSAPLLDAAWTTLPSASRERALATVGAEAERTRRWAGKLRTVGDADRADAFDGEAAALEALVALGKAAMGAPTVPRAAVAYVFRGDLVLSVTRADTGQHSAPGGKVEPGETPQKAMERELLEETALFARSATLVHEGEGPSGRYVYAFLVDVDPDAEPVAMEPGTRIAWIPPTELAASFAPEFHGPGLAAAEALRRKAASR